jgi:DNA-binding transcriptional ArsR family regulator
MEPGRPLRIDHADALDALGLAIRRAIVERLIDGPLPVWRIARAFPVSRAAISQHLRVLRNSRLVVQCSVRNRRWYAVNVDAFDAMRRYFSDLWAEATDHMQNTALIPWTRESDRPKSSGLPNIQSMTPHSSRKRERADKRARRQM